MPYSITRGDPALRSRLEGQLHGLDRVDDAMADAIVTAWATSITASAFDDLADVPWDPGHAAYRLLTHVNEVTRNGLRFAAAAAEEWHHKVDLSVLVPILILHDVDKPMLFEPAPDGSFAWSALSAELPHGVIGGMICKELGLGRAVVATVSTHSPAMPFRGKSFEAWVLFYADHFSCDNELLRAGMRPVYELLSSRLR